MPLIEFVQNLQDSVRRAADNEDNDKGDHDHRYVPLVVLPAAPDGTLFPLPVFVQHSNDAAVE